MQGLRKGLKRRASVLLRQDECTEAGTAILSCRRVTKSFGALVAVNKMSFEVQPGSVFGIGGPNGAGKTTMFDVISGVQPADNGEVIVALNSLIEREGDALVVKLPRTPGRKDSEYMHLFGGPIDADAHAAAAEAARPAATPKRGGLAELSERVERLEAEVAELKEQLGVQSGD